MPLFGFFNKPTAKGKSTNPGARGKTNAGKSGQSRVTGRYGASSNPGSNVQGSDFQFSQSTTLSTVVQAPSYNLNFSSDSIGWAVVVTVALTGNTNTTADQLTAFGIWQILGPQGNIMTFTPAPAFYMLPQRFGPQHIKPSVVALNGTTATTGYYMVYGINLPKLAAPSHYTLIPTFQPYSAIGTATTGGTVTISIESISGDAQGLTSHYAQSNLPFTPSASGVNDLVPVSPVQDIDLTELFIYGLTSNMTDISFISATDFGPHVLPSTLVQKDDSYLPGTTMDSDKIFPLLAGQTNLNLTGGTHFWAYWGASPSSTIGLGFYWLSKD